MLIHGWTGDADASWSKFSQFACDDPQLKNTDIYGANYPTYLFRRNLTIMELSSWLYTDFFAATLFTRYLHIHIIAHSMGGIIARQIYIISMLGNSHSKIESIISVGSPFLGADLAGLADIFGVSKALVADMSPNSNSLREQRDLWVHLRLKPETYCISSPQDLVVEQDSAEFQCVCYGYYPQWGHVQLEKPKDPSDARYKEPIMALTYFMAGRPGCP